MITNLVHTLAILWHYSEEGLALFFQWRAAALTPKTFDTLDIVCMCLVGYGLLFFLT